MVKLLSNVFRPSAPSLRFLALAAALAASPACRRGSGPPPERFLSANTGWALVVPDLRRAAKELGALHETASTFPGAGAIGQSRAALKTQLGFDPLNPDALAKAGIEPSGGLAIGMERGPRPGRLGTLVLVLPVRNAAALERTVARLARERLGATEPASSTDGGIRIVNFRREGTAEPALALGFHSKDRTAALAPGREAEAAVRAALSRPAAESLGEARAWREMRGALADRTAAILAVFRAASAPDVILHDTYVYGPHRDAAVGFSASGDAVRVGIAVPFGEDAAAFRALKGEGDGKAALRALSPGAPLVLLWTGDPAALGRLVLPAVPEADRRRLAKRGLDLQRDVFDLLAPGAAASVSLSPRVELRELSEAGATADPLGVIRFELVAAVKDEARAAEVLARLPARIATPSGELAWRLDGKRLLVAGGPPGAIDALASRKAPGWTPPTKASAAALEGGLGGAVLVPRALVAGVHALPDEAFGSDPTAFIARTFVANTLAPLERLEAVSARAELREAALVISVELEAAKPAKKKEAR